MILVYTGKSSVWNCQSAGTEIVAQSERSNSSLKKSFGASFGVVYNLKSHVPFRETSKLEASAFSFSIFDL